MNLLVDNGVDVNEKELMIATKSGTAENPISAVEYDNHSCNSY